MNLRQQILNKFYWTDFNILNKLRGIVKGFYWYIEENVGRYDLSLVTVHSEDKPVIPECF